MYTTKGQIMKDVKSYSDELLCADREILSEIRIRENEINSAQISCESKSYGLQILQKLADKQEQVTKAHETQWHVADISEKLLRYAAKIEEINKRYASSIEAFETAFDLRKVVDIETKELERIRVLAQSVEKIVDDLPGFDDLAVELITT